jgi:hypothetical protein
MLIEGMIAATRSRLAMPRRCFGAASGQNDLASLPLKPAELFDSAPTII